MTTYGDIELVNIGSGNALMQSGKMLSHESMMIYCQVHPSQETSLNQNTLISIHRNAYENANSLLFCFALNMLIHT